MSYRNIILIGALVLGIAIVVLMYVRRGFLDLQGQIDDIETVLASMPPALTSGVWAGAAGGGIGEPSSKPPETSEPPAEYYNLDEDIGNDDFLNNDDEDEQVETLSETDMAEFDLSGAEVTGIATLSEPGYYDAGSVHLEVTPIHFVEGDKNEISFEVSELAPLAGMNVGVQEGADNNDDDTSVNEPVIDVLRVEENEEETFESVDDGDELPTEGSASELDEYAQVTLPELKARLKAILPETKGLARLKRAEVIERLRSVAVVETDSDK
jgi:hypothetical protein